MARFGHGGEASWGAKSEREERGEDAVAHREDGERVSVLEEGLTAALRSPMAEEEDEI